MGGTLTRRGVAANLLGHANPSQAGPGESATGEDMRLKPRTAVELEATERMVMMIGGEGAAKCVPPRVLPSL